MSALNLGIPVLHDETLERGVYLLDGVAIYMHPLTRIDLTHPTDLHARLDAAVAWHVNEASRRLDAAGRRLVHGWLGPCGRGICALEAGHEGNCDT